MVGFIARPKQKAAPLLSASTSKLPIDHRHFNRQLKMPTRDWFSSRPSRAFLSALRGQKLFLLQQDRNLRASLTTDETPLLSRQSKINNRQSALLSRSHHHNRHRRRC